MRPAIQVSGLKLVDVLGDYIKSIQLGLLATIHLPLLKYKQFHPLCFAKGQW